MYRRTWAGIILALAVSLGLLGTALADSKVVKSEPAADAVLDSSPKEVRLFFDNEIAKGTTAKVLDAEGTQVDNQDGALDLNDLDRKTFFLTVPALSSGTYTVEWQAVGGDGHSTKGSFTFSIQAATPTPEPTATPDPTATPSPTTTPEPTLTPEPTAAPPTATTQPTTQPTAEAAGGSAATPPADRESNGSGTPLLIAAFALIAIVVAGGIMLRRARMRR